MAQTSDLRGSLIAFSGIVKADFVMLEVVVVLWKILQWATGF